MEAGQQPPTANQPPVAEEQIEGSGSNSAPGQQVATQLPPLFFYISKSA